MLSIPVKEQTLLKSETTTTKQVNVVETVGVTEQMLQRQEFSEGNVQHMETMQGTYLTIRLLIFLSTFLDFEVFNLIFGDSHCCTYPFHNVHHPVYGALTVFIFSIFYLFDPSGDQMFYNMN